MHFATLQGSYPQTVCGSMSTIESCSVQNDSKIKPQFLYFYACFSLNSTQTQCFKSYVTLAMPPIAWFCLLVRSSAFLSSVGRLRAVTISVSMFHSLSTILRARAPFRPRRVGSVNCESVGNEWQKRTIYVITDLLLEF